MGVSFILNKQLAKHGHKLKPNVRSTVQKIVPFTAVACASCKYDSFIWLIYDKSELREPTSYGFSGSEVVCLANEFRTTKTTEILVAIK